MDLQIPVPYIYIYGPRSDKRGLMAEKIKIKILITYERPSLSEYFLKILRDYLYK